MALDIYALKEPHLLFSVALGGCQRCACPSMVQTKHVKEGISCVFNIVATALEHVRVLFCGSNGFGTA